MQIAAHVVRCLVVALIVSGCASVLKGRDQSVSFKSEPSGARVVITDARENKEIHAANTPFTTVLKRGAGYFKKAMYKVTVEQAGYDRQEVLLQGKPGGWYLGGNLLFGGSLGYLIVDPVTGAMWTLVPEDVNITLKKSAASLDSDSTLQVMLLENVPAAFVTRMKPVPGVGGQ